MGRWGDGNPPLTPPGRGIWEFGEMGRWGDGEMGRWEPTPDPSSGGEFGEMGRWGDLEWKKLSVGKKPNIISISPVSCLLSPVSYPYHSYFIQQTLSIQPDMV
ncbi:hypothetical protein [Okeania sp. SIO1I7]|uniref:hypothetical protein n=1 Tax=Okeania sp. SIO1I7 TaxID=2607772 RepID=UPI0025CFC0A2|nr:hypothetical protein [Okeania sp. SIO1I7]